MQLLQWVMFHLIVIDLWGVRDKRHAIFFAWVLPFIKKFAIISLYKYTNK